MSEENRPNLHAVGLMTDILHSIDRRRRGSAARLSSAEIFALCQGPIQEFIEVIDERLSQLKSAEEK